MVVFPRDHSFKQCLPPAPKLLSIFFLLQEHPSSLETRASPRLALSPPQLSLTLHLHFSSSHLSLIGPSSLLSLVPSSSR